MHVHGSVLMRRYAADYFCRCDEIMLCRCMPRKSPMMPAARRICLSALENDYLGVAAVAAVAAYEYKAGVGDHAVADTEIGEFYLCSEIDIMVAQQTHPLAAGSGILEIDILSGKLVQRKRVRQSLGFKQRIYLIEQLSAKLVICRSAARLLYSAAMQRPPNGLPQVSAQPLHSSLPLHSSQFAPHIVPIDIPPIFDSPPHARSVRQGRYLHIL